MTTELTEAVSTPTVAESTADAGHEDLVAAAKEAMAADDSESDGAPAIPTTPQEDELAEVADEIAATKSASSPMGAVRKAIEAAKEKQRLRAAEKGRFQQENIRIKQQQQMNARREYELEQTRIALESRQAQINEAIHDPAKFAELSGTTVQDVANRFMIAGSPEQQIQRKAEMRLAELEAQIRAQKSAWDQHQEQLKQQQEAARQQQVRSTEQSFIRHSSETEKYPNLAKLPDSVRLNWGYEIANKYYAETKKVASDEDIAEYIENSLTAEAEVPKLSQQKATNGKAPTNRASGPRTLSRVAASERRSAPRTLRNDLSQDELFKELVATAREANMTTT